MKIEQSTGPPPPIGAQVEFYDHWNLAHHSSGFDQADEDSRARGEAVLAEIGRLGLAGPSIVEVGCGTGWLTERLAAQGQCHAIDLSPRAIEHARTKGIEATFEAGDFLTMPDPAAPFDLAVVVETLFYVYDQRRFVERVAAWLRPGGYLVLTAVNPFVYQRWGASPLAPGQIRHWLTHRQLVDLLKARFEILSDRTIAPRGHGGILRIVNSIKLNHALDAFLGRDRVRSLKERFGFGHCRVIVGRAR